MSFLTWAEGAWPRPLHQAEGHQTEGQRDGQQDRQRHHLRCQGRHVKRTTFPQRRCQTEVTVSNAAAIADTLDCKGDVM